MTRRRLERAVPAKAAWFLRRERPPARSGPGTGARRSRWSCLGLGALWTLGCSSVAVVSVPSAKPVGPTPLQFEAPVGCPGPEHFIRLVSGALEVEVEQVRAPLAELLQSVRVSQRPATAELQFRVAGRPFDTQREETLRRVTGADCHEAVAGAAFIAALAVAPVVDAGAATPPLAREPRAEPNADLSVLPAATASPHEPVARVVVAPLSRDRRDPLARDP